MKIGYEIQPPPSRKVEGFTLYFLMPKIPGHSEYLLQLSMDGPDTNWIVLAMLHYDHCEKDIKKLLTLALVAYLLSVVPLGLVLRLQIVF